MENLTTLEIFAVIFVITFMIRIIFVGGFRTFQRQWIAALLLLLFFSPLWFVWALFESFRGPVPQKVTHVHVKNVE